MKTIKPILLFCLALVAFIILGNESFGAVGATTPFISMEGESGLLGGGATVVSLNAAPTTPYSSPELEASGHAFVQLTATGQYVQWTNDTGQNITALNLRACIPDAPAGGGTTSTIDLYVNGIYRQAFAVNSLQNYCYEGTNYNGQTDKNPADGNPRGFWNDTHAFIAGPVVAPGDTIMLQKDPANNAAFYDIDVVDLEAPPPPLTQPANSLSITSYGAVSNSITTDNTTAINNCFKAARSQQKIAWIPPGTFYISAIHGGLNASDITIQGAGMWYSTISRVTPNNNSQGVANIITTTSCTLQNVALDCNSVSRAGNNNNGAVNFSGTNWLVDTVWIQHVTSAFWCAGVSGTARNCRVLSVWSDGGNFNNVQSDDGIGMNLTYSNNFVRGTGDDAMAINSVHYNGNTFYTMMSNITYANNTAIAPWGGKCMGIYGGTNDFVTNNLLCDTARYLGLGIMRFGVNGSDLLSAVVTGNTLIRCGGNGYNQQQQGIMIGNGGDSQGVGIVENVYCASNTILDSLYDGVGFSSSTNIVFERNIIVSPGMDGIAAGPPDLGSGVTGFAVCNLNTITGLSPGRAGFVNYTSHYILGGIANAGLVIPGPIPSPWLSQDIGSPMTPGGASYAQNTFTLVGSGSDSASADAFHYVYQSATGDCSITARIATEEIINTSARAGVMIRNSLDPSGVQASVLLTPAAGLLFQWRTTDAGNISSAIGPPLQAPCWLRLTRTSNIFNAFYSSDGANWSNFGPSPAIALSGNTFLGLTVTSGSDDTLCSAMFDNVSAIAPGPVFPAVHWEGDLIVNLQSSDLSANSGVWTNRTSNSNTVGNFSTPNHSNLSVTNIPWNSQTVQALVVNENLRNAVQSALKVPGEIVGNKPVSAEAWVYATAVNEQNSCAISYGVQGGSSLPEEDREFNYSVPGSGGGVSGDFGSYDTQWATTPAPGAWHHLAWTYDGSVVRLYLDGVLDTTNSPGAPLQTPSTVVGIGAGLTSGPNVGADPFQGYIAAARVESGVLSPADIATNYALGLLASASALTPSGLTAAAGDSQIALSWSYSPNAATYNLKSSITPAGPYTVITNLTGLTFTNIALSNGTTYYYVISAVNPAGESPDSAPVSAQPISATPPLFSFNLLSGQLQLIWPQDHTGWHLQIQTNSLGANWFTIPASNLTNVMSFPINLNDESIFFRLIYP